LEIVLETLRAETETGADGTISIGWVKEYGGFLPKAVTSKK
jgi:hypothetical protein